MAANRRSYLVLAHPRLSSHYFGAVLFSSLLFLYFVYMLKVAQRKKNKWKWVKLRVNSFPFAWFFGSCVPVSSVAITIGYDFGTGERIYDDRQPQTGICSNRLLSLTEYSRPLVYHRVQSFPSIQ
ncbi:hypothetical protein OUZ56_029606 [Daphnia magna]|uniref:Uncharacterized protein n=1 Tax=Daphnia magna TaxID=35525 RepID=A0ABR0B7C5_9CRUS|nr:hypothetical protein OUZ56_029606 [Daphnia magna]